MFVWILNLFYEVFNTESICKNNFLHNITFIFNYNINVLQHNLHIHVLWI